MIKLKYKKAVKKPFFKVLIPPPNITGNLHIGHAWNAYIQDFFCRYYMQKDYQVDFLAGLDHAGIATQVKIEERLKQDFKENAFSKSFLNQKAKEWQNEYSDNILKQWSSLNLTLNTEKLVFSLDENVKKLVSEMFVFLYEKKLIYRDNKIVNWDPVLKTAVSDIEVNKKLTATFLYYFRYFLEESSLYIDIATTRPETMFGDVAVFVHPKDKRYLDFHGKFVINPATNQKIKVMCDEYIDIKFGTGAMKCTPAHDFNDYQLAKKHGLEMKVIMNEEGLMVNTDNDLFENKDRFLARELLIEELTKNRTFIKKENYSTNISFSERSNAIIEPLLSKQWFLKVDTFIPSILELQKSQNKIKIYPAKFQKILNKWLSEMHDWCISRQLWWGHELPVYYHFQDKNKILVTTQKITSKEWVKENLVLDTWFSSCLWAYVFEAEDYLQYENYFDFINKKLIKNKCIPTSMLVTAYDILFFWVARMLVMACAVAKAIDKPLIDTIPFEQIYIHGLIRDSLNRKMSKSLNNGINPMDLIKKYGSDKVRKYLLKNTTQGADLIFKYEDLENSEDFFIKLKNVISYFDSKNIYSMTIENANLSVFSENFINYMHFKLKNLSKILEKNILDRNINLYVFNLDNYFWNSFCAQDLELFKKIYGFEADTNKNNLLVLFYEYFLSLFNNYQPLIPLLHDEITCKWVFSSLRKKIVAKNSVYFSFFLEIEKIVRQFRQNNNLDKKNILKMRIDKKLKFSENETLFLNEFLNVKIVDYDFEKKISFKIASYQIVFEITSFFDKFINKLKSELQIANNELKRANSLLNNESFLKKAGKEKIKAEKEKQIFWESKIIELNNQIQKIS